VFAFSDAPTTFPAGDPVDVGHADPTGAATDDPPPVVTLSDTPEAPEPVGPSPATVSAWSMPITPVPPAPDGGPALREPGLPPEMQRMLPPTLGNGTAPGYPSPSGDGGAVPSTSDAVPGSRSAEDHGAVASPHLQVVAADLPADPPVADVAGPVADPGTSEDELTAEVVTVVDTEASASVVEPSAEDGEDTAAVAEVRSINRLMKPTTTPSAPRTTNIPASIAARNGDLYKGTREFPDLLGMAMKGSSLADAVEVKYDASSMRKPATGSAAPKDPPATGQDRNGKRWKRKGR